MTPRETMLETFHFRKTEVVPHNLYLEMVSKPVRDRLDRHYGGQEWFRRIPVFIYGNAWVGGRVEDIGDGLERDSFGCVFRKGNVTHRLNSPLASPTLSGYAWPEAESLADWPKLGQLFRTHRDSYRLCGVPYGYLERSMFLRGFESFMMDMEDHPRFVNDLMERCLELRLEAYDLIAQRLEIDAFFGGGDDCDNRGPLMGIERWRTFIKPRLAREIERAHSHGKPYVIHQCGNMAPLLDDLLEIGIDGLDPLQPEPMDVYALKRRVSGRLVLFGGMGSQSTLPYGTPEGIRRETFRLVEELGRGGGYILQPAKPIMEDVPTESAVAFIDAALEATARRPA